MNIIWSNSRNEELVQYVRDHVHEFVFERHHCYENPAFGCSCENTLEESDLEREAIDTILRKLPVYCATIKQIAAKDVEEVFEGTYAIHVFRCNKCQEYAIDVDE